MLHSDNIFMCLRHCFIISFTVGIVSSSSALRRVWSRPGSDVAYTTYYANYCYYA